MIVKAPSLYYGRPGTGKTEGIIARMIEAARRGLKSVAFVGDGSTAAYAASGLVEAGYLLVVPYTAWDWPFSVSKRLSTGWLPADVSNPQSRWVNVDMARRAKVQPDGSAIITLEDPQKRKEDVKITKETLEYLLLPKLGVVAIEGAAVMSIYLMGQRKGGLQFRASRGEKIGENAPLKITDLEYDPVTFAPIPGSGTGESFGGNPMSHYGFVQGDVVACIQMSAALNCEEVIWTSHEKSAEDRTSKEIAIGPEVAGGALTANLGRLFGDVLHFQTATKRVARAKKDEHTDKAIDDLDVEYRVYTRDHVSPDATTSVKFLAITRGVSAGVMPAFLTDEVPGNAVLKFYEIVAREKAKRIAGLDLTKQAVAA